MGYLDTSEKFPLSSNSNKSDLITHDVCFKKRLDDSGSQELWSAAVMSIEFF